MTSILSLFKKSLISCLFNMFYNYSDLSFITKKILDCVKIKKSIETGVKIRVKVTHQTQAF